ncbi:ABC transporter ATP-binding protein/permease [Prosthecomicrobium sp. N25]|uniref:ABC transporter ATP-binding protein/permease n=1 Tax=Prosthecomicrobium sp. N25 TaxID=3129254 RepID=UPI003077306E
MAMTDAPPANVLPTSTEAEAEAPRRTERPMLVELASLLGVLMRGARGRPIQVLVAGLVAVLVANMVGQVRLNTWNGAFFDAIQKKDVSGFWSQLLTFLWIAAALLSCIVAQTWLQETLKMRIRARLSEILLDTWLKPRYAYWLGFAGERGSAADQRLQEDCRLVADFTTELGVGLLQSTLLLVTFTGVLWGLSTNVTFEIGGNTLHIPGYMVWVAILYAGLGSGLTWLVGRPLIALNTERYAREADFRFALVRIGENAEGVALHGGEADERRNLDGSLGLVLASMRKLSGALSRLTWITSGYGWLAMVVPVLAAAPGYFSGDLSFGSLMMVVGAFTQVQTALRYFVDQFPRIADWRSAVTRVSTFRDALADLEDDINAQERLKVEPHPEGKLTFDGVAISLIGGRTVIDEATVEIAPGERVLITGESGSGKSTMFRAVAGLWPWGSGTVLVPPAEDQMFMPQRPYMPLGSLRQALSYPSGPDRFTDEEIAAAMRRCRLEDFVEQLDREDRWDKSLSLGQQQRVAFTRVLLHRPRWVFMDEATSALDDDSQAAMLSLFSEDLAGTTILSIAHRPGVEAFHTRTLRLEKRTSGTRLFERASQPVQKRPKRAWLQQIRGLRPRRGQAAGASRL